MSSANPKSQEPTMEEILASIRRIIADDQAQSNEPEDEAEEDDLPAAVAAPAPVEDDEAEAEKNSQSAVDDMFDSLGDDFEEEEAEPEPEPEPEDDGVSRPRRRRGAGGQGPARAVAAGPRFTRTSISATPPSSPIPSRSPRLEQDEPEEEPDDEPSGGGGSVSPSRPATCRLPCPSLRRRGVISTTSAWSPRRPTRSSAAPSNMLAHAVLANQGRTLDDLVKEMLRPMLKDWLDDNLPTIVERLGPRRDRDAYRAAVEPRARAPHPSRYRPVDLRARPPVSSRGLRARLSFRDTIGTSQ